MIELRQIGLGPDLPISLQHNPRFQSALHCLQRLEVKGTRMCERLVGFFHLLRATAKGLHNFDLLPGILNILPGNGC